jgi:hypothetical protein
MAQILTEEPQRASMAPQGDVHQHGADDAALRGAVQGWGESAVVEQAGLPPPLDHSPGGEPAQLGEQPGMIDSVDAASRSASRTHCRAELRPLLVRKMASIASWQPRPGRNP